MTAVRWADFTLNPPSANVPGNAATQGNRSVALLEWIESPIGLGLPELEAILESIITTQPGTVPQSNDQNQTIEALKDIIKTLVANQAPKYDMRGTQFGGGFAETVEGDQIRVIRRLSKSGYDGADLQCCPCNDGVKSSS